MVMTDTPQGPNTMSPQTRVRHASRKTLIPLNSTQGGGKARADPTGEARTPRQAPRERCPMSTSETTGAGGAGMLMADTVQGPTMTPP